MEPTGCFPASLNIADYFLFDRLTEGLGDACAVRFGERGWTFADVAQRSRALARYLVDDGLGGEQRVYVVLPDVPPFVWSIFGTIAAGGILTMGNPALPASDLCAVLSYVKARVMITTPEVAASLAPQLGSLPALRTLLLAADVPTGDDPEGDCTHDPQVAAMYGAARVRVQALASAVAAGDASTTSLPKLHRDDPCVWLFTSGSTGQSKAAMHTHRDFAFNTEVYAKRTVGYRRGDVCVSVPRLFFGYATGTNLWFPFAVGGTACLFSERPTAETLYAAIERYRPTIVTNVPTMLSKLLDLDDERRGQGQPGLDLSCVRFHLSAGEALPQPLLERFTSRFGGQVFDGIGSAEMFHIYCSNRPGDVMPGTLGRAVEGYELRVLPKEAPGPGAAALPPGDVGILWVRGDSVAIGYYQDRDKSWQTFHGHWCCTGDLFRIDARGYLTFVGRADDLFKVGGIFVAPVEVEECLMAHPAVSTAAVIPEQEDGLTKPKAMVVLRPEARDTCRSDAERSALAEELKAHVRDRLSKHKYPRWVVFVDDLPKNDRGKVDKKRLLAEGNGSGART